jgi:hypothetical protein
MSFLKPAVPTSSSLSTNDNRHRVNLLANAPQQRGNGSGGLQTTSTPYHEKHMPPYISNNIVSPPQFDSSGFNSESINHSTNPNSFHQMNPPLINIINNSSMMSDERVISYQHAKRIVNESESFKEAELREKELYLEKLRSIDITKFSFPNE